MANAQLIVDGRVVALDADQAKRAFDELEGSPPGDVLVAMSCGGQVLVRWVSGFKLPPPADDAPRPRAPKRAEHPWLYENVEVEFDHVVAEHGDEVETLHTSTNEKRVERGKRPEAYRRWLSKLKKRWVRAVVSHGERVKDLGSLG